MHRFFLGAARAMAVLGGAALTAVIALTVVSIMGRALNGWLHSAWVEGAAPGAATWLLQRGIGPVTGDFELVEAGVAFAVFAFLPLCQIMGGHASVDLVTARLPVRAQTGLAAMIEAVFALALCLIAWRLYAGMLDKQRFSETTFMLQMPVWWAYAACLFGAAAAAVTGIYVALARLAEAATGRSVLPPQGPGA